MARCWLCENSLTEGNRSQEHVIPAALGGKRTVADFLCRRCNNTTGSKWDARLIETSKPMDFVASQRDWAEAELPRDYDLENKSNRHEIISGKDMHTMYRGGGDSVTSFDGQNLQAEIAAYSEAQRSQILKGTLRRYAIPREKWVDIEQAVSAQAVKEPSRSHSIQTGMALSLPAASRAMVKSMLALACQIGVTQEECSLFLANWRANDNSCLGCSPEWQVLPMNGKTNLRCVAISGSGETGMLLGFAQLTGFLPWILPLSVPYEGPSRHGVYAIDAKTRKEVSISLKMERPRAKAVAIETAVRLAEGGADTEDMSREERLSLSTQGHLPNEAEMRSLHELFASKLRPIYSLERKKLNQMYRVPLGLPPIGDDGKPCEQVRA